VAAVGEAVGRDVQHAHDPRLRAELQRAAMCQRPGERLEHKRAPVGRGPAFASVRRRKQRLFHRRSEIARSPPLTQIGGVSGDPMKTLAAAAIVLAMLVPPAAAASLSKTYSY